MGSPCPNHKKKGTCDTCRLCKGCPPIAVPEEGALALPFSSVLDHDCKLLIALMNSSDSSSSPGDSEEAATHASNSPLVIDSTLKAKLLPVRNCWGEHTLPRYAPSEVRAWLKELSNSGSKVTRKSERQSKPVKAKVGSSPQLSAKDFEEAIAKHEERGAADESNETSATVPELLKLLGLEGDYFSYKRPFGLATLESKTTATRDRALRCFAACMKSVAGVLTAVDETALALVEASNQRRQIDPNRTLQSLARLASSDDIHVKKVALSVLCGTQPLASVRELLLANGATRSYVFKGKTRNTTEEKVVTPVYFCKIQAPVREASDGPWTRQPKA